MTDLTVEINKTIHAPIEKAFDAWLDPKMLSQFMTPTPGMPESDVKNDAREGGDFIITMHVDDKALPHTGKYIEIARPNKLVFSWVSHRSVDNSLVSLNFTKLGGNKTQLVLTHVKFIDEAARADHEIGWGNIVDKLNAVIA